ncbi:MAG: PaaI family thioesterase [Pseudomonadota bacterium]
MAAAMELKFTADALAAYLDDVFHQAKGAAEIKALDPGFARLHLPTDARHLRPGGVLSGPTLFLAVDYAFYAAVLGVIGPHPMAVTANVSINFMRPAPPADLIAEARILKLGARLAFGDVTVTVEGANDPVAHAAVTYALPERD